MELERCSFTLVPRCRDIQPWVELTALRIKALYVELGVRWRTLIISTMPCGTVGILSACSRAMSNMMCTPGSPDLRSRSRDSRFLRSRPRDSRFSRSRSCSRLKSCDISRDRERDFDNRDRESRDRDHKSENPVTHTMVVGCTRAQEITAVRAILIEE